MKKIEISRIEVALQIALAAHAGQKDKDGRPAILHPLAVALMGADEDEIVTGLLHDVIEDSEMTLENVRRAGMGERVVSALGLLTHEKGVPYEDYVTRIATSDDALAKAVKRHDLTHNLARGKAYPKLQMKHGGALAILDKYNA